MSRPHPNQITHVYRMPSLSRVQPFHIRVESLNVPPPIALMSSLAQQLKEFNKTSKAQISQSGDLNVPARTGNGEDSLGESKKGQTFAKAFEDQAWTEFILSRFEHSQKPEHMMYVHYIRLRLQGAQKKSKTPMEELRPVDGSETVMDAAFVQDEMSDLRQSNQSLQSNVPSRDDHAGGVGASALHACEDGGIGLLSRSESERLQHSTFAEGVHTNMTVDTGYDFTHDPKNMGFQRQISKDDHHVSKRIG